MFETSCLLLAALLPQGQEPSPANLILVMTDDQGWGDAGYQGHPELLTPNLDEMAASGIRFDRFYAGAPVCSPTRGSCLTGRHPFRYGIFQANVGHLPADEPNLAEILRARGYRTGHFGKWHLGTLTTTEKDANRGGPKHAAHYAPPWERGFDVCFSTESKVPTYDPLVTPPKWAGGVGDQGLGNPYGTAYWTGPGRKAEDEPGADLSGDDSALILDRALPFLESAVVDGAPFFAVIWFHAPHLPVLASEEQRAPYAHLPLEEQHYFACMSEVDHQLGRLRAALRGWGVAEDTILWFCSDNGPEGKAGKAPGSAGGLRGRKRDLYEGGVRVPGLLEWPRRFPEPQVVTAPCSTLDYLPTMLGALGLPQPADLDGVDLLPLLDGRTAVRGRPIGFESGRQSAWSEDRYKLLRHEPRGKPARLELYDLAADPGEDHDLAGEMPERVAAMDAALLEWRAGAAAEARALDPRPNLVFVMADDLGAEWLSFSGGEGADTPTLDRLAAEGTVFRNAWSMPLCTPSRVTLLTGQYPFRHGWIRHWDVPRWGCGVHFDPERNPSFARMLRRAGYATAIAGKWQVNDFRVQPEVLAEHGFDEWCVWTGYETGNPASAERYHDPYLHTRAGSRSHPGDFGADRFTDFLIDFARRERRRPKLLYFPLCLPHTPFVATPAAPDAEGKQARYRAMVEYADRSLGRLLAALEQSEEAADTILIFTADNGSPRAVRSRRDGREVQGGKNGLAESGCNVPFLAWGPGRVPAGAGSDALLDFSDLLPTFAELAGAALPGGYEYDGPSFADALLGGEPRAPRPWILSMGGGFARYDGERLVPPSGRADRVLRNHRYKLWVEDGTPSRLYDLRLDPGEERNLIASELPAHRTALAELAAVLATLPAVDASPRYTPTPPQEWDSAPD